MAEEVSEQPKVGPSPSKIGAFFSGHRTQVILVVVGLVGLVIAFLTYRAMSGGATGQGQTPTPGASNSGSVPDTSSLSPDVLDTLTSTLAQLSAGQQQILSELTPPTNPPGPGPGPKPKPNPHPGPNPGGGPSGPPIIGGGAGGSRPPVNQTTTPAIASLGIPAAGHTTIHFPQFPPAIGGMGITGDHGNPTPPPLPPPPQTGRSVNPIAVIQGFVNVGR